MPIPNKRKEEEQLTRIMQGLRISRCEALEVMRMDSIIDKGGTTDFDLPPDKLKTARAYTRAGTRTTKKPFVPNLQTRQRPKDVTKEQIIAEIAQYLKEISTLEIKNLQIPNAAKLITFELDDKPYKLDLTATRKPKN